ncbi:calcium-dependent lipid-binding (CaLB domain) family protein [Actinidia rufa]|uniref:Calcium-dependent lipid-binding (CaLB domain) family protein n=1 Tax=Actinidia rufa TaxID=165716 RepID=A0A7J0DNB1_9ERIC|nr:calcium-dependent lipid-binding (CaLB domain) family protein [Actinidia rufa]
MEFKGQTMLPISCVGSYCSCGVHSIAPATALKTGMHCGRRPLTCAGFRRTPSRGSTRRPSSGPDSTDSAAKTLPGTRSSSSESPPSSSQARPPPSLFEIYAVGYIKDPLVGTVRFLLSSAASRPGIGTPSFTAVQVRRPSGRFHGVLNIAATVLHGLDFASLGGFSAICIRDLMDETHRRRRRHGRRGSEKNEQSSGYESCGDSVDLSDGADSTTSSSSTTSTVLKDWNSARGEKDLKSDGKALLCGLMLQRKIHLRPSDQNLPPSQQEKENRSTIEID